MTVVGDTRFDRVMEIFGQAKQLPLVEAFKQGSRVLVAGSSWQPDEDIFIPYFNVHPELKLIIAPHVIGESHLQEIIGKLRRPYVRYTQATPEEAARADCLIVDCFGLLSSIYRYGEIAYVGGGFGVGIHNVLEAAVYGVPVLFGPNNRRFQEARQLLDTGGSFEVTDATSFNARMDRLLTDADYLADCGRRSGDYVHSHAGASGQGVVEYHFLINTALRAGTRRHGNVFFLQTKKKKSGVGASLLVIPIIPVYLREQLFITL